MMTFEQLKRNFETDTTNAAAAQDLAAAVCSCVIRRIIDKTSNAKNSSKVSAAGNNRFWQLRSSLYADIAALKAAAYAGSGNIYAVRYKRNGDTELVVDNDDFYAAANYAASVCLGDGADMMQEAAKALYSVVNKYGLNLDAPIRAKKLGRRIYIDDAAAVTYSVVEYDSTPIQEVFKAVRRHIQNHSSISANERNYTYIDEQLADDDIADFITGEQAVIYRRLPKFADISGGIASVFEDADGCLFIDNTTDADAALEMQTLLAEIMPLLSQQQQSILTKILQGNARRSIAEQLNIKEPCVWRQMDRAAEKLIAAGIFTAERIEKIKASYKCRQEQERRRKAADAQRIAAEDAALKKWAAPSAVSITHIEPTNKPNAVIYKRDKVLGRYFKKYTTINMFTLEREYSAIKVLRFKK